MFDNTNPKVSVVIPTHNRPELLKRAIKSVLNQTYQDFEIIVVDDGDVSVEDVVKSFSNSRVKYIKHKIPHQGGSAARNTGIKASKGEYIAFLDDDDEWLPKKLEIQMKKFEKTGEDVGFCFSAVRNILDDREENSEVPEGIANYYELALRRFKGFLTVTLIVKKFVFDKVGFFDDMLPSHQEVDLMIRISKKYKGLGINKPLTRVNMKNHGQIGKDLKKRSKGREMILKKYYNEFRKRPKVLAKHYFQLGLWHRDNKDFKKARQYFFKTWKTKFKLRYFLHFTSVLFGGKSISFFRMIYNKYLKSI